MAAVLARSSSRSPARCCSPACASPPEHDRARHRRHPHRRAEPRLPLHERLAAPHHRRGAHGRRHDVLVALVVDRLLVLGGRLAHAVDARRMPTRAGAPRRADDGGGAMNLFVDAIAWIFSPDRLRPVRTIRWSSGSASIWSSRSSRSLIAAAHRHPARLAHRAHRPGPRVRGRHLGRCPGAPVVRPHHPARARCSASLARPKRRSIAFVLLAIPSILAGAYAGFEAIDRRIDRRGARDGHDRVADPLEGRGAARAAAAHRRAPRGDAAGRRDRDARGVRRISAASGYYIIAGIPLRRFDQMLGGAILVAALALLLDGVFALAPALRRCRAASPPDAPGPRRQRRPLAATAGAAAVGPSTTEGRGT